MKELVRRKCFEVVWALAQRSDVECGDWGLEGGQD